MIRINLLPVRAAQKKEMLQAQLVVAGLVLCLAVGVCIAASVMVASKVEEMELEVAAKKAKQQQLNKQIGEVRGIEAKKKELMSKLQILDQLRSNRTGPVRILDELSHATPEKLWVENFALAGAAVDIKGVGLNQETVADFMRNLENSPLYQNVELVVIDEKVVKGRALEHFSIKCSLEPQVKSNK
ncbi:PilN domain-containing protein [Malonomonas rubra]|uniref:PilN domain-containing protein n=1 Tax=Malonomonas rubra TaxID=57040 RepID=UPI0026F2D82C|nr:PilN domain-containing protein [Malonomonas rubra]